MGKLCIYLPPFASDYSGVCSALFDLNCLTVINDASCCTAHFVYYDEPRWAKTQRPTLSTQLRTTDAIFGNDAKVVDCVLRAAGEVETDLIALVGTPVPAMTGMDMPGIACEIESACGRPAFGFNTTGFEYYDRGIYAAGSALIDRFCGDRAKKGAGINILGMMPLDFGDVGNDRRLSEFLRRRGFDINASLFFDSSIADVKRLPRAGMNLAVCSSGLLLAKKLERKYGTPYLAAFPMGRAHSNLVARRLSGEGAVCEAAGGREKILLIGDQVMMESLREALYLAGCRAELSCASFFCWDGALARDGDFRLETERQLTEELERRRIDGLICDPLLTRLPAIAARPHRTLVHPAVSSRLEWDNVPDYFGEGFEAWLAGTAAWCGDIGR